MKEMEGEGPRHTHLLNPIRDLADNWNIDVAHELEEYLAEVKRRETSAERTISLLSPFLLSLSCSSLRINLSLSPFSNLMDLIYESLIEMKANFKGKKNSEKNIQTILPWAPPGPFAGRLP